MNKRLPTAFLLAVLLAACSNQDAAAPADATAAGDDAAVAAAPAAGDIADEPALAPGEGATAATEEAATPADPSSPQAPAPDPIDTSGLVAGRDYDEIPGGQPFEPLNGKVEVVEVFAYWCGACAQFDPLVSAWRGRLPADVRFTYVPAVFSDQDNYPRAYYAAETAGILPRVHDQLFSAIHIERSLRQNASVDDIAAFFGSKGANADQMKSTMQSFAINAKLGRAKQFAIRSGIQATPTMVVNGKYRIKGNSFENILENTSAMVARERAQASAAR
jgi:protein dithiol oxidoreductase (disulfide-forming)